jgi:hypothetical protein
VLNDCAAVSAYLEWEILTLDCWIHVSDMEHCMVYTPSSSAPGMLGSFLCICTLVTISIR